MSSKDSKSDSTISNFFTNKSVLITGVTGFVAKVILYKLLLSCEGIHKIYLLIRSKHGISASQRLSKLLEGSKNLFAKIDTKLFSKLVAIEGDISLVDLGLSAEDRKSIIKNVSIIFHSAANINFQTDLKRQITTNVGGTQEMIDLSRQLKQLDAFVFVSTAYSNSNQSYVDEKVYNNHFGAKEILKIAQECKSNMTSKEYLSDFPNTYTFTKNLAENLIKEEFTRLKFAASIVRPSLVFSSLKEPECGWIESLNSTIGSYALMGVGLARIGQTKLNAKMDLIPVDIVANTCISVAWVTATKYKEDLRVYNCNTSSINSLTIMKALKMNRDLALKYPLLKTVRPLAQIPTQFEMMPIIFHLIQFISETCFAYLCDFALFCIGEKRFVVRKIKKYQKLSSAINRFILITKQYSNINFIQINEDLISSDKEIFACDVRNIQWKQFFEIFWKVGIRLLLNETEKDIFVARRRFKYLKFGYMILHHFLILIGLSLIASFITPNINWSLVHLLFNTTFIFLITILSVIVKTIVLLCND